MNSHAMKILINERNEAYGVRFKREGRVYNVFARREVILSSGAINSPQLLMLSGIGPAPHLAEMGIPLVKVRFSCKKSLSLVYNIWFYMHVCLLTECTCGEKSTRPYRIWWFSVSSRPTGVHDSVSL